MRLETTIPEELVQAIAAAVVDRLRPMMASLKPPAPQGDDLMTVSQLAKHLGASKDKVYRMTMTNEIPFLRVGRAIRFRRSEVDQWLAKRSVPDVATLSAPRIADGRGIRKRVIREKQPKKTCGCEGV